MKIKKIISIVMAVAMILSISVMSVSAASNSITKALASGRDMGVSLYLSKGETAYITITETSPFLQTKTFTPLATGAYKPGGYDSKVALSVNDTTYGKNKLYKTFKLNSQDKKASKTYKFTAKASDTYFFCVRNLTKVSRGQYLFQNPTYRLSVNN